MQKLLSDPDQRMLSKRGSAVVDARTNTLFVQDTPTRLEEVRRLHPQDRHPGAPGDDRVAHRGGDRHVQPQPRRAARLPRHDRAGRQDQASSTAAAARASPSAARSTDTGFHTGADRRPRRHSPTALIVNLPAPGIAGAQPGRVLADPVQRQARRKFLNLELTALQADGKGKIISSPRVITADQVEATIEQGTEIPYQQATSSGATSVSFKKATLSLKVKPQITPDDNVIMNLNVHKDSVGPGHARRPLDRHQADRRPRCWSRTAARW